MTERSTARIKICGFTRSDDIEVALDAGVDMLGLNFVAGSPRAVSPDHARELVGVVGGRAEVVGVVADRSLSELSELRSSVGIDVFQLHGAEPPEYLAMLSDHDYKAVRIGNRLDIALARLFPGRRLLVDAKVQGQLGGTGRTFDWSLVAELATERQLLLAGGLTPGNVAKAVDQVRPWAVDAASGVESAPGQKDPILVAQFVANARTVSVG
jgi:phosphoribosylanthranilate isomerase